MSWEKLILRKIRISTSDTARQCPQSEVDDVWQILEKPASRLMDAQPDLKEHVPSHLLLSGLHGRRRRRNIKPSPEMPRIEGTPRGAFVPHPKRESSSGSWNEVIKQNDDAQPEPIQEFQQEPEDPNPGHSSQTNKVRNLKRKKLKRIEGNTQGAKRKRKSSSVGQDSNAVTNKAQIGKCCEQCECNVECDKMRFHFGGIHKCKPIKCTAYRDCKKYFATLEKRKEHEKREHIKERKKLRCLVCHYSTDEKFEFHSHVQWMNSEKTVKKCAYRKCSRMLASEATLKFHLKRSHTMKRCPKCGEEMSTARCTYYDAQIAKSVQND